AHTHTRTHKHKHNMRGFLGGWGFLNYLLCSCLHNALIFLSPLSLLSLSCLSLWLSGSERGSPPWTREFCGWRRFPTMLCGVCLGAHVSAHVSVCRRNRSSTPSVCLRA